MSVVSVNETQDQGAAASETESESRRVRAFVVVLDDPTDGPSVAITANDGSTSIPEIGDDFPGDATLRCVNIPNPQTKDRLNYIVTAVYSNMTTNEEAGGGAQDPDPTARPAEIDWGTQEYTEVVSQDVDGDPIINSAEDPFDPGIVEPFFRLTVRIVKNYGTFTPSAARALMDTLNNGAITIAGVELDAGEALMRDIALSAQYENGVDFIRVSFLIELAASFDRSVLDAGMHHIAAGARVQNADANGVLFSSPQLLDGSGALLAVAGTPVFLPFTLKASADWSGIGLPTTFPDV